MITSSGKRTSTFITVLFIVLACGNSVVHMCFQLTLEVKSFQRKSWSKTTQWGHATFNYCGNIALMWSLSSQKSLRKLLYVPNGELGIPIFSRHPLIQYSVGTLWWKFLSQCQSSQHLSMTNRSELHPWSGRLCFPHAS